MTNKTEEEIMHDKALKQYNEIIEFFRNEKISPDEIFKILPVIIATTITNSSVPKDLEFAREMIDSLKSTALDILSEEGWE